MADNVEEDLSDLLKETVDLENIPIEEVLGRLRCCREDLSKVSAQQRSTIFGYNKLEEKESKLLNFVVAALMARLAPKAKVLRNGTWSEVDASILVLVDMVSFKLGDVIPADARLLEGDPPKIDQENPYVQLKTHETLFFLVQRANKARSKQWSSP